MLLGCRHNRAHNLKTKLTLDAQWEWIPRDRAHCADVDPWYVRFHP